MKNILHITPHLGGGIGTVVTAWIEKEIKTGSNFKHRVACLDKNNNSMEEHFDAGMEIHEKCYWKTFQLQQWMKEADLIVIHWYNHPLLFDLMINVTFPPCRIVMWNHVSGLHAPYIHSERLINFADRFIFTSPVSYKAKEIKALPNYLKERLGSIWSTCGTDAYQHVNWILREGEFKSEYFTIGFTGTVDFGKLDSNYIRLCDSVGIEKSLFIVCSGDSQDHLKKEAEEMGISKKFKFMGRVPSVKPYLEMFDVFGYPLHPQHFATCEQAMGEAMMCGAVPVVMNNPAETFIVDHQKTGFVAKNYEEYGYYIRLLNSNRDLLRQFAENARKSALIKYDLNKTQMEWREVIEQQFDYPKKQKIWNPTLPQPHFYSASEVFAESLGVVGLMFHEYIDFPKNREKLDKKISELFDTNPMWKSKSKGSVLQYLKFFPTDKYLQAWSKLIKES